MQQKLIRLPDVMSRTGYARSSIFKKIQEGTFPAPIELGPRARAWVDSEIDEWIAKRIKLTREPT